MTARIVKIIEMLVNAATNTQVIAALVKSSKIICTAVNNHTSHAETNAMKQKQYLKEP